MGDMRILNVSTLVGCLVSTLCRIHAVCVGTGARHGGSVSLRDCYWPALAPCVTCSCAAPTMGVSCLGAKPLLFPRETPGTCGRPMHAFGHQKLRGLLCIRNQPDLDSETCTACDPLVTAQSRALSSVCKICFLFVERKHQNCLKCPHGAAVLLGFRRQRPGRRVARTSEC